jgi:hypothetical protein
MEGTANLEFAVSLGASKNLKGGVVFGSADGNLGSQTGINVVGLDKQFGTNIAGCTPFHSMCAGAETTYDSSKDKLTSKGVLFGVGKGYDLSFNLVEVSDSFIELKEDKVNVQVPFINERFKQKAIGTLNRINTVIRNLTKLIAE